jgi:hypothetical protein
VFGSNSQEQSVVNESVQEDQFMEKQNDLDDIDAEFLRRKGAFLLPPPKTL